ncbi:MAG TPA: matrixin family metalloprotease [Polyangiaceae bacterium]|nr:matrixin family metalloprotease [Polyangiaceae bacterium]
MGGDLHRIALSALLAFGLSGCFFFDSRWGEQKAIQKHEAARLAPQQLQAQSRGHNAARLAQRTLRLRVYATPTYSATVVNWQKQFEETLACANAVFTPEFGANFEVAKFVPFRPEANEEKLDGLLDELIAKDDARDVDWVVGLARAVPQFAASADDLGLARLLSNHFVMRAMSDRHEYEAIQSGLDELSDDARQKLYRERKQHKLCTVFLHEIAHTLGVPHERRDTSLMHARYSLKSNGYTEEAAQIVRGALSLRTDQPWQFLDAGFAQLLESSMSAANADWEPKSRAQVSSDLAAFRNSNVALAGTGTRGATTTTAPPNAVTNPTVNTPPSPKPSIAGLSPDEQQSYDRARAELKAKHALAARELAAPLLAKRGNLPAVRELRCDIAMAVGGDWETIEADCAGLSMVGGH